MTPPSARRVGIAAVLVGLLAVAVFLPSLHNGFIWDDAIVLDRQLPYFDGPADAFFPPAGVPQWGAHYYRPMVVLSYLLDDLVVRSFYPPEARDAGRRLVFHASPVLLHGVSSALVVALGAALLRRFRPGACGPLAVPVAAGVLFALHPVHVESVAWLAGRSDVLCAAFALGSLVAFARWLETRSPAGLLAAALLALGSMLSKEVGLALVALLPLLATLPRGDAERASSAAPGVGKDAALGAAFAGAGAAVALGLRLAAAPAGPAQPIAWTDPLRTMLTALGWYSVKAVLPTPLQAFFDRVPVSGALALLGALVAAGTGALVAFSLARRRAGAEAFAAALFLLTLAPSLAVAAGTIAATPLAERYLYLPSAGAVLLFALALGRLAARPLWRVPRPAAVVLGVAAAVAAVALPATVLRQRVWRDDLAFWSHAAKKSPGSWLAQDALGTALAGAGRLPEAEAHFRRAAVQAERPLDRARVRANLGSLLARQQRWDDAIAQFREALADDPQLDAAHGNLGQALLARYAARPRPADRAAVMAEAAEHFDAARRLDPRQASLHLAYGMLMIELGRPAEAAPPLREVIAIAPGSREAATARRALETVGLR
ncbi:MAG: tetratricopeptide repeat protein [Acidobacteria bacterium]|nr:tetratricopeptide repeat protein [Acidobacteriota bacterium]